MSDRLIGKLRFWQPLALMGALSLVVAACGGGTTSNNQGSLAASQVLKFPVYQSAGTFDPGEADAEVDTEISQNVFDNLWRFDDKLNLIPDLATEVPSASNSGISSDGLTYTIHLKSNVKFNNGDSFSSKDVLYSFNRAVALQGAYASILNQKTVQTDPENWWSKPVTPGSEGGMVGTGAFYLSAFTAKQSMTFKSVSNWWGTPKPTLKEIDIAIHDPSAIAGDVTAWEQGSYDLIGYGGNSSNLTYPLIQGIKGNARFAKELITQPKGRTTWVSFNVGNTGTGGPFLGSSAAAKGLRMAFALAVNKQD